MDKLYIKFDFEDISCEEEKRMENENDLNSQENEKVIILGQKSMLSGNSTCYRTDTIRVTKELEIN